VRILAVLFLFLCCCTSSDKRRIGIQPLGDVSDILLDSIADVLAREYNADVLTLEPIDLPASALITEKTRRYRADKIIHELSNSRPDSIDYILGVTAQDISTTKKDSFGRTLKPVSKYNDWGVFGLGYRPGKACVVSTFRIGKTDRGNFIPRLQKLAVHEIGHNYGLDHCDGDRCVMRDAVESISTIDEVDYVRCERCRSRSSNK
jgi:archaemetzincin